MEKDASKTIPRQESEELNSVQKEKDPYDIGWERIREEFPIGTEFTYLGIPLVVYNLEEEELCAEYFNFVTGEFDTQRWEGDEYQLILKAFKRRTNSLLTNPFRSDNFLEREEKILNKMK